MSGPVRVGFVGCGQIAQAHLATYQKVPNVQVVALCDIDESRLNASSEKFGVAPENRYTKYREMLKRDDLDAIDVCLHNNLHMPATVLGLESGRHVYCEKPMAGCYRDAAKMLETAQKTGRKLHIQLGMIYSAEARAARELIEAGELGHIYHARSTGHRRRGRPYVDGYGSPNFVNKKISAGGALYDMGVYHISQLLYLLGNPKVERVTGKTYAEMPMSEKRAREAGWSVEELGLGFVRFAGNLSMDIIEAWSIHLDTLEGSSIVGSKGGVRLAPFGFFRSYGHLDLNGGGSMDAAKFRWTNVEGDWGLYQSSQHHWIAALRGEAALLPTAEIALNTMLIQEAIYLSEKLGREVTADEVKEKSLSLAVEV